MQRIPNDPIFTEDEYENKLLLHKPKFQKGVQRLREKWSVPESGFLSEEAYKEWRLKHLKDRHEEYKHDVILLMRSLDLTDRWHSGVSQYIQTNAPNTLRVRPNLPVKVDYDNEGEHRQVHSIWLQVDKDTTQREIVEAFKAAQEIFGESKDKKQKPKPENLDRDLTVLEHHQDGKKKNQAGPRKNGNPKYALSNHVTCVPCLGRPKCRFVGFDNTNGKSNRIYEKYRCRSCGRWLTRRDLHNQVEKYFKQRQITVKGIEALIKALNVVWDQKEGQAEQEARRIKHKIESINGMIANQVEAATDPSNIEIKQNILDSIAKKKDEIGNLEDELSKLKSTADTDKERFMRFALNFVNNMGSEFLTIAPEHRLRCKQLLFPAGFYLDADNRVYTPEISPIYGLATKKKDAEASINSHLVRVGGL
ncbi:MAG TPA: hypothetical protein VNX65_00490 [Patescibacteria group bacterium]|jgi:hypothetical protein|nr:hypothetical protein [Patescibacteria group bacterium]